MMPLTIVHPHFSSFNVEWSSALELDSWVASELLETLEELHTKQAAKK